MFFQNNIHHSLPYQRYAGFNFRTQRIAVLVLLISLIGFLSTQSFSQPLANGKSKFVGCATNYNIWPNLDLYWNQITPGNDGKWGSVEATQGDKRWYNLDNIYNYAIQRGFPYKHHNLIWGNQQPSWITSLDSASQRAAIEEWIRTVGQRYPQMSYVDVVNEPFRQPPPYTNALGGSGASGYDWVITAFTLARQYCAPGVKLLLNEYNVIHDNTTTTRYIQLIDTLKERGLIDGIGIQGHYFEFRSHVSVGNYMYDTSTIRANLDRLTATGLPIYITEFDIDESNDATQLAQYQKYFPFLWNHPGIKGITLSGYIQGNVWTDHPDTYLLLANGTERPALQWLRTYLSSGNFQSYQSGNWNDVNTWSKFNGTSWINPAPNVPTLTDGAVTILNGHTVTVTASDTTNKLTIASGGTLVVNPSVNFVVQKGFGAGMMVFGTCANHGTITRDTSAMIVFGTGGKYAHEQNGGSVPIASWASSSTCQFDNITSTVPSDINQNFNHVVWNSPAQSSNMSLGWHGITISGNITVQNTGTGQLQMCTPSTGTFDTVRIGGDVIQSGGQFTANGTSNANTTIVINHNGNINITGGDFSISRGSQGGTGTTTWNLTNGNFSMSNATTQNLTTTPNGVKFVFSRAGRQTLTLGSGNSILSLPIEVKGGTTLGAGTSVLSGSGFFSLDSGATLECGNIKGLDSLIKTTGTITLSKAASYIFNGSTAQVTGNLLPDSVVILTVNNAAGVTLSKSVVVNGTLNLQSGTLSLAGDTLSYGVNGTLAYLGTTAQTTSNSEFPSSRGPKDLLVTNSNGVTLHAARKITGNLNLSGIGKFMLGDNDFTTSSILNTTRNYYVVTKGTGALKLATGSSPILFPVGTKSGYAAVTVKNAGTPDTIGVSVKDDSVAAPYGGRVMVRWNISSSATGSMNDSIQLSWIFALTDNVFRSNMQGNSKIFHILNPDTAEAGSGAYTYQLTSPLYSVSRGGITALGTFYVGSFGKVIALQPSLVSPASNALNQPSTVKLICNKVAGVAQYHWQLSTNLAFSSFVVNDSTADTTRTVTPLATGTKYYWRVRSINPTDMSAFAGPDSFTVMTAPAVPVLALPGHDAQYQRVDTLVMKWYAASLASGYECQLSLSASFSTLVVPRDSTTDTTFMASSLQNLTKYYWRVRAYNIGGASAFSAADSFTTGTTNAVDGLGSGIPKEFSLLQNYPNPFNPSTTISYDLPKNAYVKLMIYDVLGRNMASLVDGMQSANRYSVEWNPSRLSSGIYFYRIHARSQDGSGEFTSVKKLLFMK
jgi:endo-1,4-beta-xylanase